MNQSEFLAIISNLLKAREKSRVHGAIGFDFASDWLKNWRESFKPIIKCSNRSHVITFYSHLKTAQFISKKGLVSKETKEKVGGEKKNETLPWGVVNGHIKQLGNDSRKWLRDCDCNAVGEWLKNLTPLSTNEKQNPNQSLFSIALSKSKVIATNFDWLIALFALVVIGVSTLVAVFRQARKSLACEQASKSLHYST